MYKFIKLSKDEFNTVILNTAIKKGMSPAIVEKDFWVCITLDYLFHHCKWQKHFAFKGGTCLSKVYHFIERFSEDIDLIIDWRVLGYRTNEPWEERTNNQQHKFIENSKTKLNSFLKDEFLPEFINGMSRLSGFEVNAFISEQDIGTIIFAYPSSFSDKSILKVIKIEAGILASWIPLYRGVIKPFVAEEYPNAFLYSDINLLATTSIRTFWEKITILHQEAFRPIGSLIPLRYSRHYYDIYCMCKNGVNKQAIKDIKELEEVVLFKKKFYPRSWDKIDLVKKGTLRLLPPEHSIERLRKDYVDMRSMIYGEYPSFDEILKVIKEFETEMNKQE